MEQIQFIYFQYYMQYYTVPSQRKQHVYGNLASWMMVQAPPTTASFFWFYYSHHIKYLCVCMYIFIYVSNLHYFACI